MATTTAMRKRRLRAGLARQILPRRAVPLWRLIYWPARAFSGIRPAAILGPAGEILRLTTLEYRIVRGIYLTLKDTALQADRYLAKVYDDDQTARSQRRLERETRDAAEALPGEWVALHHYHGVDPRDFR